MSEFPPDRPSPEPPPAGRSFPERPAVAARPDVPPAGASQDDGAPDGGARLAAAEAAADEREALLGTLFDAAPLGLGFFDLELRFRRVNRALADINGVPAGAHLGRTLLEVLPRQNPRVLDDLRRVLETGVPLLGEVTGETPADPGVPHTWEFGYYPVRGADGAPLGADASRVPSW